MSKGLKRKRADSYSPTVSRICAKLPASVTHRAYTRCRSTVLKRARVHDAPRTIPFDQELALQAAIAKLRSQIDMEQRALDTFLRSAALVGHKNAARVHQLRKNEHMLRTRRIKSLEKRLEDLLKQTTVSVIYGLKHQAKHEVLNEECSIESSVKSAHESENPVDNESEEEYDNESMHESIGESGNEDAESTHDSKQEAAAEHDVEAAAEHEFEEAAEEAAVEHEFEEAAEESQKNEVCGAYEKLEMEDEELSKPKFVTMDELIDVSPTEPLAAQTVVPEPVAASMQEPVAAPIVVPEPVAAPVAALEEPTASPIAIVKSVDTKAALELEIKLKNMEKRIKEMEEALRLSGDAAEAAKLVLKLRAQLKRANVEEIEWDFMADGAYEAAMAEHAKVTAWLDSASPAADKRAYFENEKMQDTWLNRAMMTPRYAEIIQEQKDAWRLANMAENEQALHVIRESYTTALSKWSVRFREERSRMFRFVCNTDTEQLSKAHPSDFINVVPNKPDARELRAIYFVVTTIKFKNDAKAWNLAEEVYNMLTASSSRAARKEYALVPKISQGLKLEPELKLEPKPEPKPPAAMRKVNPMMGGLMAELGAKLNRRKSAMDEPLNTEPVLEEPKKPKKEPVRKEPPLTRRASSAMFAEMQSKLLLSGPFSQKNE